MSSFHIRPRFKHRLGGSKEQWEQQLRKAIEREEEFMATYLPGHLYIKIDPSHQHFWSPQLHLTFEEESEQVLVRGLYGPNPTVWALIFFGYVALGILSLFIGMWGFSRYSLGMDATVLWAIPMFGVMALVLYIAGQMGQKLGAQQMFDIHHFYEAITKDKVIVG